MERLSSAREPVVRTHPFLLCLTTLLALTSPAWSHPLFPQPVFPVGSLPEALVVADFNGDRRPDLAVPNSGSGEVTVLMGRGDGDFATGRTGEGTHAVSLAVGDFNRDGRQDLAAASPAVDGIFVLIGNGDGTFADPVRFDAGEYPVDVAVQDFNGDGGADVAAVNRESGDVSILLGDGHGGFTPPSRSPVGSFPWALIARDLDGDGKTDLAVATYGGPGEAVVLKGRGDGSFGSPESLGQGAGAADLAAADFDGDGQVDLAVANQYERQLVILLNAGGGTFHPEIRLPWVLDSGRLMAADLNEDGRPDLVTANGHGLAVVLPGQGDGSFDPPRALPVWDPGDVVTGDFNGDRHADLAFLVDGVILFEGDGRGNFGLPSYETGDSPIGIEAGDFNGDGETDLAVANYGSGDVSVLLGRGDGTFEPARSAPAGPKPQTLVAGDFNGDGKADLFVGGYGGEVWFLAGGGDGSFSPPLLITTGKRAEIKLTRGDFNADGLDDLVLLGGSYLKVVLGGAGGTFTVKDRIGQRLGPSAMAVGHFDSDGREDVVVAYPVIQSLAILPGRGDGTFGFIGTFAAGTGLPDLAAADFNADGKTDVAAVHYATQISIPELPPPPRPDWNLVSILLGSGDSLLGEPIQSVSGSAALVKTADFDGDGNLDVAVPGPTILPGLGDGSFGPRMRFGVSGYFAVGDFNDDGWPDVAGLSGSHSVTIFLNQSAPANHLPLAAIRPVGPAECTSSGGAEVALDGSGSSDPDSTPGTKDDIAAFYWFEDYGRPAERLLGTGETLSAVLPLGEHRITLRVTDRAGAAATDEVLITISDTVPPRLSVSLAPAVLWPPNHQMVDIPATVTASDACGSPVVILDSILSSMPGSGSGGGSAPGDISGAEMGTPDYAFRLRAVRSGRGEDRFYTVTYAATDAGGNRSTATALVRVPHDRRRQGEDARATPPTP